MAGTGWDPVSPRTLGRKSFPPRERDSLSPERDFLSPMPGSPGQTPGRPGQAQDPAVPRLSG
jgi:hypothetical protein